jgi:hypothetical protein
MGNIMRPVFSIILAVFCLSVFGQKAEVFKKYLFNSTYSIAGVGPTWIKSGDDYKRFAFKVDKLEELDAIKKLWVFDRLAASAVQQNSFQVFVIKDN